MLDKLIIIWGECSASLAALSKNKSVYFRKEGFP